MVHRVQAIESVLRDQGYRIVATGQQSADMLERIVELERDNTRLRDMIDVASQRVARNLEPLMRDGSGQEEVNGNGGNGNEGNGNRENGNGRNGNGGNRNGNGNEG
ncbi:hypothetical protein Tco_1157706 [Tanacetum coccineum]